jgi:hypothetical protein
VAAVQAVRAAVEVLRVQMALVVVVAALPRLLVPEEVVTV